MNENLSSIIEDNIKSLTCLPYTFISVVGVDAEKFLQGQLTCDVASLSMNDIQFGTANTPKGRMYGLFKIIRIDNGFLLRLESSTADLFISNLSKYKVFFKCDISIETHYKAYGYIAEKPSDALPENPPALRRYEADFISPCVNQILCFEIWSKDLNEKNLNSNALTEEWFAKETESGIPELYALTQGQFILQYLNLQDLGAVSFNKGCYTGQEIIARMKFLGKQKKKMFSLHSDDQFTAEPGSDILDESGNKCGVLVRSHWSAKTGAVALGILAITYAEKPSKVYLDAQKRHLFLTQELHYPNLK